jgi:hypothetical protein
MLELLRLLVRLNRMYLRRHPGTPRLYQAGVRYLAEGNLEELNTIPNVLKLGRADCEDLAAYRVAELQELDHEQAELHMDGSDTTDGAGRAFKLYHIRVKRADGMIEDPSAVLGMRRVVPNRWNPIDGVPLEVAVEGAKFIRLYRQGSPGVIAYMDNLRERRAKDDPDAIRILDFLKRIADAEPTEPRDE